MDFQSVIAAALDETGATLRQGAAEIAAVTAMRGAELASLVGQPGYDQAVIAARDEISLIAGISIVNKADKTANRVRSVIQGSLMFVAGAVTGWGST